MRKSIYTLEQIDALLSGRGMAILGRYDTVDDVQNPVEGGHYYIGTDTPYHVYTYISGAWVDAGTIQGPKGDKGDPFTYEDFTPEQLDDLERGAKAAQTAAEMAAKSAANSAGQASTSEQNAAGSASAASTSETNAKASEESAQASQTAAQASQKAAADSASAAQQSATSAANSAAVYDDVVADVNQLKQDIAAETRRAKEAEDNRIKKFYTSNLGAVSIADSDDGAVRDLVIIGNSKQKQYSGKNLLNAAFETTAFNGITCTNNGDGTYTLNGTATNNAEFVLSKDINLTSGTKYFIFFLKKVYIGLKSFIQLQNSPWTIYLSADSGTRGDFVPTENLSEIRYVIRVDNGLTLNNVVIRPMITTDENATFDDFEPYVGGIPSPNPDYPQEIKSVEGCTMTVSSADGTKTQEAAIPVTLRGIGDVRDELIVYADGTGKLVRRYQELLDPTKTVAEQALETPVETLLTADQVRALYDLRTHYGGTNITFSSDNGIDPTVNFDYACALNAFVEYIKTQQGDTREMIYDMEDRLTQAEVAALEAAIDTQIMAAMMEV